MKKLALWFEHADTLCLEFIGQFDQNASWYKPFWQSVRQELGARDPRNPSHWVKRDDSNTWRLLLASASLRQPLTLLQAREAVCRAVEVFNGFPHNLELVVEEK